MIGALVQGMYKKSILFEIINSQTNDLLDSFTLTIPPSSIKITQPQRIKRTKTFGGVWEDDYGLDNGKIIISGDTGGVDGRPTYKSKEGVTSRKYDGQEAIYYLYDNIIRYKDSTKITDGNYDKYELRIYDLSSLTDSKMNNMIKYGASVQASSAMGYIISLDEFDISRSKERPLFYNYNIELFIIGHLGTKRGISRQPRPLPKKNMLKLMISQIRSILNFVKGLFAYAKGIMNQINALEGMLTDLQSQMNQFVDEGSSLIISANSSLLNGAGIIAKFPMSLAVDTMKAIDKTIYTVRKTIEDDIDFAKSIESSYDSMMENLYSMSALAYNLVVFGKTRKAQAPGSVTIPFRKSDSNPESLPQTSLTIYGHSTRVISSSTSMEKLANDIYGDPSYAVVIADYNGISDDASLETGDILKLPNVSENMVNDNNFIFDSDLVDENGTDIKLDITTGRIIMSESGDYSTVSGGENLIQSLNLRFSELLGKRVRLSYYGLRTQVGSSFSNSAPLSYLVTNIKDTALQDPRIRNIEDMVLKGAGDSLMISFNLITIDGIKTSFSGVY